jgi:methyl-accepting chemotaxis protein
VPGSSSRSVPIVMHTLAWQSYGDTARAMIANSYPQLGWLAPQAEPVAQNAPELVAPSFDQQQLNAISVDLDAMLQSIDKIATSMSAIQEQMSRGADRIADSIGANQEQIARSVDQLTAGQEQMTREITKLQAVEQYVLYKNAEPPPRSAPAPARNQVLRSSQAR